MTTNDGERNAKQRLIVYAHLINMEMEMQLEKFWKKLFLSRKL
jgi:hypothetical protein